MVLGNNIKLFRQQNNISCLIYIENHNVIIFMKILLVSSYLPYPLFSGGNVRLYNVIKELSVNHSITLVCEIRDYQTQEDIKEVAKFCTEVITVPRKKQWSVQNILKTAASMYSFLLIGHTSKEMKKKIVQLLIEKHFDIIHVETSYVFQNIPKTYLPVVLVEHNIEYLVYQRYMHTAKIYLRLFLFLDILKLRYWERKFWQQATKLIAVSEKEKEIIPGKDTILVPNGVDLEKFKVQNSKFKVNRKTKKILFIGNFKWIQNRQALEYILKEVWQEIKSKVKNQKSKVTLWVVGKHIPEELKILGDDAVVFDEHAPDETWKIYHQADVDN